MHRDCEYLLFQQCEPLAVLASRKGRPYNGQSYEAWGRLLLQNSVHDCICGVSVDQVHEKMELGYQQIFDGATQDMRESLSYILQDFAEGLFAVSTNPFPYQGWHVQDDTLYAVQTQGVGVWAVAKQLPIDRPNQQAETFAWQNEHYTAQVKADGTVQIGATSLGALVVTEERGDTYSNEAGERQVRCQPNGPLTIEQTSPHHAVVRYDCTLQWDANTHISTTVRLIFDQNPLVKWEVDLDSRGTNFSVDLVFETAQSGPCIAGMPFDMVERAVVDNDLLPRQLEGSLAKVLLGQRELNEVRTFPFHDFVGVRSGNGSVILFAKGVRAYHADEQGTIALTLRRSVEWLTAAKLQNRAGDAGPFMYVPDARCERTIKHEIAVLVSDNSVDDLTVQSLNAGYQTPPLIVQAEGKGTQSEWLFVQENLPLTSLQLDQGKAVARFFNPTNTVQPLSQSYPQISVLGEAEGTISDVSVGQIVTVEVASPSSANDASPATITPLIWPTWRVGENEGQPAPELIAQLEEEIKHLSAELAHLETQLAEGGEDHRVRHRYYIFKRELYEAKLSAQFNQRKLSKLGHDYLYQLDPEIADLSTQLNNQRIKRRIYDYVVESL